MIATMPYGDPPPWPWNDAIGYLPWWALGELERPQERLGQPFETILFDNAWELYARDKPALWFWADQHEPD